MATPGGPADATGFPCLPQASACGITATDGVNVSFVPPCPLQTASLTKGNRIKRREEGLWDFCNERELNIRI